MKARTRVLLFFVMWIPALWIAGCSDDDPARVEGRRGFGFDVRVTDPAGAPVEGLRVAAGSLVPCEFSVECLGTSAPSSSSAQAGPQAAATLQFSLEADARVTVTINDRDGGHVRTLHDAVRQKGYVYSLVWDGRDDAGEHMPSGEYEICMVATDAGTGAVLYEPDCILVSLYAIIDMSIAADAIGYTDAAGRFRTTSRLPFPYLYGDTLTAYDAEGTNVGVYTYTDEITINVVDETAGLSQRFIRTLSDNANRFDLVFDPVKAASAAPAARGRPERVPAPVPIDPGQIRWSFGPLYPNPFN